MGTQQAVSKAATHVSFETNFQILSSAIKF